MASLREKWLALQVRLNPDSPPASLDVYIRPPKSFGEDIVLDLEEQPGGRLKFLLIGPRGGGKSTELRKIADLLRKTHQVYPIDLDRSGVSALNVSAFDLLYLSGVALLRGLRDEVSSLLYEALIKAYTDNSQADILALGDKKAAIEGVASFLEKTGDTLAAASAAAAFTTVVGIPAGIAAATASITASRAAATGARLLAPRTPVIPESSPRGLALQGACAHIVGVVRQQNKDRPVAVVIDGLEKMNGQAGSRFREIFENTRLLANAPWSYVIAAPPCTMTQTYSVDGTLGYSTKIVWGFPPPSQEGPATELVNLLESRIFHGGLDPKQVEDGGLSTIAQQSGGLPRSAISILRRAIKYMLRAGEERLSNAHITEACNDEAESLGLGLDDHRLKVLQEVQRRAVLPSDDEAPTLFADGRIIAYPPERRRGLPVFRVHPLLRDAVEEYRQRTARE